MKIRDIITDIGDRDLPSVSYNSDINDVIDVAAKFPHTREVYVIDEQKKLLGVVTMGGLMKYLYPFHYQGKLHTRDMLRNLIVEQASHLMSNVNVTALLDEDIETIIKRMATSGAEELAVVDSEGRLIADITIVDILSFLELRTH